MSIKWFGAALILAGCGGVGLTMAAGVRQQVNLLSDLNRLLDFLEAELQYRLTTLPELASQAAQECSGILRKVFTEYAEKLRRNDSADAASCMDKVLECHADLPVRIRKHLKHLGHSLGRYDLPGQLRGLQAVRNACMNDLTKIQTNCDVRQRSYQTLALCAGTALVILFV